MLMMKPKGRIPSLLAWGLLVGGVALLITFPAGTPPSALQPTHLPAALLFALAGIVFGMSHPEDRVWTGAILLGWVPIVLGIAVPITGGAMPATGVWIALMLAPAVLAGAGSWVGATIARRRAPLP